MSVDENSPFQRFAGRARRFVDETEYELRMSRELDPDDDENPSMSEADLEHYFAVGSDAVRIIVQALVAQDRPAPAAILDYPSGSGRVTRHLAACFPEAELVAADLYRTHSDFCAKALNCTGIVTPADVTDFDFPRQYDVIFCGSLLTHLPRRQATAALELIARSLSPTGIAVVTFHGRRSDHLQATSHQYIDDKKYGRAKRAAELTGFGFANYDPSFRRRVFHGQRRYGVTLTRPWWTLRKIAALPGIRILGYSEMEWDGHQDVVVFGRPDVES